VKSIVYNARTRAWLAPRKFVRRGGWIRVAKVGHDQLIVADGIPYYFHRGTSLEQLAKANKCYRHDIEDILRWYMQPENAKAMREARGR
jgi:hypothetical protein